MDLGAIALDGANGARVARVLIANSGVLDGERVLVGAGRGLSRRVGVHWLDDSSAHRPYGWLSTCCSMIVAFGTSQHLAYWKARLRRAVVLDTFCTMR